MTAPSAYDPKRATGYPMEQLASAFDRVRDPRDWKGPIRAMIPVVERHVVEKAVRWFTETEPRFEEVPGETDRVLVVAPGYRLGPAGGPSDHIQSMMGGDLKAARLDLPAVIGDPAFRERLHGAVLMLASVLSVSTGWLVAGLGLGALVGVVMGVYGLHLWRR